MAEVCWVHNRVGHEASSSLPTAQHSLFLAQGICVQALITATGCSLSTTTVTPNLSGKEIG